MDDQDQKQLEELKRRDLWKADIHFTASEDFCMNPTLVYCSKKLNDASRALAIPRLKYMSSVMVIVDHYRTHMCSKEATLVFGEIKRQYDLSKTEDVMMLASYFPYTMQHLFLMNMELIVEGCFDQPVKLVRGNDAG